MRRLNEYSLTTGAAACVEQAVQVPTPETSRLRFFMDRLMEKRHPVMLVGPPGSGKTVLINDKLGQLSDDYLVTRVPFNFYTTSGTASAPAGLLIRVKHSGNALSDGFCFAGWMQCSQD